ncbi:hypothetical protein GCM10017783_02490 [Deinococcus piscis]|uniref:Uncharacterized protein n=1 Tax=Deinococcus piscis TaxID=394230 RepID=A0ABQ3K3U0_9DEIO|nr:hypothetical protein [Deinococcus piscis]GHF93993.1 hypothetical protein GCM10017783_02490 [Deinococcus piscis]
MNTDRTPPLALALARTLDLTIPSNQLAAGGLLAGLLLGRLSGQSWAGGLRTGAGAFAAWATARELDPDHAQSAAAALAAELLLGLADPPQEDLAALEELLAAFVTLGSLRLLSATVGTAPTLPEQLALAGGALATGTTDQKAAALIPGAALLLSHTRGDDLGPEEPWTGVGALTAALLPALLSASERDSLPARLAALGALVVAPAAVNIEEVNARNDLDTAQIAQERVKSSRLLATGALAVGLITGGSRGLRPLSAACAAVGVWMLAGRRG